MCENYISFPTLGAHGRLGNVMFQYAAGKSLAMHHNIPFKVPNDLFERVHHSQQCLLNHFEIVFDFIGYQKNASTIFRDENIHTFYGGFFDLPPNTELFGHFEHEKFFEPFACTFRKEFTHKKHLKQYADAFLSSLRNQHGENVQIIALHMRRGDALNKSSSAVLNDMKKEGWLYCYLSKAMDKFHDIKDKVFLVFTGGATDGDNSQDVEWCKNNIQSSFPSEKFAFVNPTNSCIHDHAILTQCNHMICSTVSTFAWWAGYLNPHNDARIVVPSRIPFNPYNANGDPLVLHNFWAKRFIQLDVSPQK